MSKAGYLFLGIAVLTLVGINLYLFRQVKLRPEAKVLLQEYTGKIVYIEPVEQCQPRNDCHFGLFIDDNSRNGKAYELVGLKSGNYQEGEDIKVVGVLTIGRSPLGLDGTIEVGEIQKLE